MHFFSATIFPGETNKTKNIVHAPKNAFKPIAKDSAQFSFLLHIYPGTQNPIPTLNSRIKKKKKTKLSSIIQKNSRHNILLCYPALSGNKTKLRLRKHKHSPKWKPTIKA